jgi:hypothetical protein
MPLASNALTSVANVKEYLQQSDTGLDAVITNLINRYSLACINYVSREFAPATSSATRTFVYNGSGKLPLNPYDLRSATTVTMDVDSDSPTVLTADQYALRPKPSRDAVFTWIQLPTRQAESEVSVAGAWGFASVPVDVEEACIIAVLTAVRTRVSATTSMFNVEDPVTPGPQGLPWPSKRLLDNYKRNTVA